MTINTLNKNGIVYGAIIFLALFIIGLIIYNSGCNNKVSSPCENTQVMCNLNNFTVYNKTQNVQNISFYYLNLICNYDNENDNSNNTCIIQDGMFYNYDILIDYFNFYYNNTNVYNVYLLPNITYCSFDIINKDAQIVVIGLCIMVVTTILFLIVFCYYYQPYVKQQMNQHNQRSKYVRISDNVNVIESPPVYSPN